jgi:hypothetical protein
MKNNYLEVNVMYSKIATNIICTHRNQKSKLKRNRISDISISQRSSIPRIKCDHLEKGILNHSLEEICSTPIFELDGNKYSEYRKEMFANSCSTVY